MTYALHEILEVHELTAFKTVCLTKSKTMQMLVSDPQLKALMQRDVELSTGHLLDFESLLSSAHAKEALQ